MPWELRVRGLKWEGRPEELRTLKEEAHQFLRRIQSLGHRIEVVFEGPDGSLDVYEMRPPEREA